LYKPCVGASISCDEAKLVIKLLDEAAEALAVIEDLLSTGLAGVRDRYALRYAVIELVEALASASARLARALGASVECYVDAMKRLGELGIVSSGDVGALIRLARLRNLLVHRYWIVDDGRILEEAGRGGVDAVRRALEAVRRFVDESSACHGGV